MRWTETRNLLKKLKVAMSMSRLALRSRTENRRNIIVSFNIGALSKVKITPEHKSDIKYG